MCFSKDHACCPGYFGRDCFKCPGTVDNWCSNNGKCQDGLWGSGECLCYEGFHGTACEMCEPGRYGKDCKSGNIHIIWSHLSHFIDTSLSVSSQKHECKSQSVHGCTLESFVIFLLLCPFVVVFFKCFSYCCSQGEKKFNHWLVLILAANLDFGHLCKVSVWRLEETFCIPVWDIFVS